MSNSPLRRSGMAHVNEPKMRDHKFYLQPTFIHKWYEPYLPLLPSCRASLPFVWYSFYHLTKGRRLSQPRWLVTYGNKVPSPAVEPRHSHPSQY